MKKRFFKILFSIFIIFNLFSPLSVFADSEPSYIIYDDCGPWLTANGSGNQYYFKIENNASEVRIVAIGSASTSSAVFAFSESSFTVLGSSGSCPALSQNSSLSYKGVYYRRLMPSSTSQQYGNYTFIKNIPLHNSMNAENVNNNDQYAAWYYTFGAGAVAPETPSSYGDLVASYTTQIAGSGFASVNNTDVISWDLFDSYGNDISSANVDIRVHPGYYSADSESHLLLKTYHDFLDYNSVYSLGTFPASSGSVSFTWLDVIDVLDNLTISEVFNSSFVDNSYILKGWYYEARFVFIGDVNYFSSWVPLYSVTSSGVQNQETIINSGSYNYAVYLALEDLTTINNGDSITYYINEQPYTVNNSTINNSSVGSNGFKLPNFWDYLASKLDSFKDAVLDLFGIEWDFNFSDISDSMNESFGFIQQTTDILENVEQHLLNLESAHWVLNYPGLQVLGVQFFPSMYFDFDAYFYSIGLSRSDLLFYTDGFSYFFTVVFCMYHVIWVLRR